MILIGKGYFSKVYDNGDNTVLIKTTDPIKEGLSMFVDNPRFPKLTRIDHNVYLCKKYEKTTSIKNKVDSYEWSLYSWLKANLGAIWSADDYKYMDKCNSLIKSMPFPNEVDHFLYTYNDLLNYGTDLRIEISPRNVFIDEGKIVYNDIFFLKSLINYKMA